MTQLRTRRRNGRIQYYNPKTKKFQNTKPTVTKPTPTPKPDPNNKFSSASQKGSRNFSGSKPGSSGGAGYADEIAKLKELAKSQGPKAKAASEKLAKLGIRVAPGAVIGGAMLTTIGKPGQSRMSKFGSLTGRQAPVAKPASTSTSSGVTAAQRAELRKKNAERTARIKRESDAKVTAGRNDPNSPFYRTPSGGGGGGEGGRRNVTPTPPARKREPQAEVGSKNPSKAAKDSNMKAWAKANPSLAKKVKKGQAGYEAIQSVINPQAKAKPANVGPVKDGAKYARSLTKSGVQSGAKNAAKADNRLQATESVRAGMRQGRTADENNEKKKKQRRFSNESLRRAGQRTYNRGAA